MPDPRVGDLASRPVPASFIVEELTDAENLVRFASFQNWLDGAEPFMFEGRIERSLAASEIIPPTLDLQRTVTGSRVVAVIAGGEGVTVGMEVGLRYTEFRVSATTQELASQIVSEIETRAESVIDRTKVPARVWTAKRGGSYDDRMLDSPVWSAIEGNYPKAVRSQLASLMALPRPETNSAKLILWHGEPGTGKTTALRCLAREWQEWASLQYISDPERLFAEPDYLAEVLDESADEPKGPTFTSPSRPAESWHLVVAEDADEFLKTNARDRAGAALGRVLNVSDGILGEHRNVLLLLTTNEEVSRLHPALVRPGRCLSNIAFSRFTIAEANQWRTGGKAIKKRMTLAELLAARGDISPGSTPEEASPPIGAYL